MKTSQVCALPTSLIALALATVLSACTIPPILIGQWYVIATPPAGDCPRLEWRFVVNAQRSIAGFLARDGQQRVADLSGLLNADDSFQMTATSVPGTQTMNVTGQFTSQVSTVSIHGGGAISSACDGQTFTLRLGGYFLRQGGGGGGGG